MHVVRVFSRILQIFHVDRGENFFEKNAGLLPSRVKWTNLRFRSVSDDMSDGKVVKDLTLVDEGVIRLVELFQF